MKMQRLFRMLALAVICSGVALLAQQGSVLRFCLHTDPKTLNPLLAADEASETIRYLTGGVLVRLNRKTQQLDPELATAWKLSKDGRSITFTVRQGVRFSDGTPLTAEDVRYTVARLMDPGVHSPTGDAFRAAGSNVAARVTGKDQVMVSFPGPIVELARLFDELAILSEHAAQGERAVLGPYVVAEWKAGAYVVLKRNPNYWKRDGQGRQLPYIESIRMEIEQNREMELLRLMRGEIDFITGLGGEEYDRLAKRDARMAIDAGVSLDAEQMWFNQVPAAPLPEYKKAWFRSVRFRQAISESINREDLARVAYRGHAQPAVGWISPANRFWLNASLKPWPFDQRAALALLAQEGFQKRNGVLLDAGGHPVEFSIITNAGNKARERMATMIQQDLAGIGIRVSVVTLDFPSLIERITRSYNYDACLLGLVNDDLDPDSQMNVWLSSAGNHQWNPNQKTPATQWEGEIDRLMREQATTADVKKRKAAVDRVQRIVWEEEPFLYLVYKHTLLAVSPAVRNAQPVVLRPEVYWNIDRLWIGPEQGRGH